MSRTLLLLALLLGATPAHAGSSSSDFSAPPAGASLYGTATVTAGPLELTTTGGDVTIIVVDRLTPLPILCARDIEVDDAADVYDDSERTPFAADDLFVNTGPLACVARFVRVVAPTIAPDAYMVVYAPRAPPRH